VGRLFDAVASLLDVRHDIEYEAQAAIELEAAATQALVLDPGGGAGPGTSPSDAARSHPGSPAVGQDQPADPSRWPDAGWVEGRSKGDEESHGAESGGQGVLVLDPAPWIARAAADHAAGVPAGVAARAFHAALARSVLEAAERVRGSTSVSIVGLTGGVFANALLTEDCVKMLEPAGFTVLIHRKVPPNDGGLALGQVAVAAAGGARRRL
jgi:hydrogenase maturation protein HypF